MKTPTSTCSAASEALPSPQGGPDSERLPSASANPTPSGSLQRTSGRLWPTPIANDAEKRGVPKVGAGLAGAVLRPSTPTCEPSPATSTQRLLFSPEDSHASLSVFPGSEQARKMTASSGRRWFPLLKLSGPLGLLARMCLESSRWNSTVVFLTWNGSATPAGRSLFRLVPSEPSTDENECGLWPTARSRDWKGQTQRGQYAPMDALPNAVAMWPTPRAAEAGADFAKLDRSKTGISLPTAAALWPTPRSGKTTDETEEAWTRRRDKGQVSTPPLTLAVKMWRSPTVGMLNADRARDPDYGKRKAEKGQTITLADQVRMYPTPDAGAAKGRGASSAENRTRLGGSLNPTWVEALMGFPPGWTEIND